MTDASYKCADREVWGKHVEQDSQNQRNNSSHFLKEVNKFSISKLSIFLKKYQSSSATILEIHI